MFLDKDKIDKDNLDFTITCQKLKDGLNAFMKEYSSKNKVEFLHVVAVFHSTIAQICKGTGFSRQEFDEMHTHTADTYFKDLTEQDKEFADAIREKMKEANK